MEGCFLVYFIVNPLAGFGKAETAVPIIEKIMRENNIAHFFIYTNGQDDCERVSGLIDFGEAETIACVGGDGTIQEYIGLAVGREITFCVIPAGSGNDTILAFPNYTKRKFSSYDEKIIFYTNKIIENNIIAADAIRVNGEKYLFNIGGTGIDIQVLQDAQPLKRVFGGASYFLSLIKNVVTYKTSEMTLTVDGRAETDKFLLLAFCNGSYYGGGMRIAPPAVIDDGCMTICKIKKMPRLKMMVLFPKVKTGAHADISEVSFENCSSVKLEFEGKKIINLDGNLIEYESPLTFEIIKGAVKLIV